MPPFDLKKSFLRAESRLPKVAGKRSGRRDRGSFRIDEDVAGALRSLLATQEFPGIKALMDALRAQVGPRCPSRTTLYRFMERDPGTSYAENALPTDARAALYNVAADASVPGAQLVFYCFNYGSLTAVSFAAGLPWLPLHQAAAMRGWRARSRGLLVAVLLARGIPQ